MAEHRLHGAEVDARLEHVGGKAVPQGMGRDLLLDAGTDAGLAHGALDGSVDDVSAARADEEPLLRAIDSVIVAQQREQRIRQWHEPILAPLAGMDMQELAGAIDVDDTERGELTDAEAAGVGDGDHDAVASVGDAGEEGADLVLREDSRELALAAREGHEDGEIIASWIDVAEEEPQGAGVGVVGRERASLLADRELPGTDLVGGEPVG